MRQVAHAEAGEYDREELIRELEQGMLQAAAEPDFEWAAALCDHIKELNESPELKLAAAKARPMVPVARRDADG